MTCCSSDSRSCCRNAVSLLVALAALLIVAVLVWAMKHYTTPEDLTAQRAEERRLNLAELKAAEKEAVETDGWLNPENGVVRLKLDRAVALSLQAWQNNPEAARADLIDRVEKATYVPPPPPEEPSDFE